MRKLQSAMEYLMTYGWSILIIAVILPALYSLGAFSSTNFAPKAPTGSCQIFRPNGPMTLTNINTEGTCNNELPEYVAQLNGANAWITPGDRGVPIGGNPASAFAWVYVTTIPSGAGYDIINYGNEPSPTCQRLNLAVGLSTPPYLSFAAWGCYAAAGPGSITLGAWHFVGYTFNGAATTLYIDGQSSTSSGGLNITLSTTTDPIEIGKQNNGVAGSFFKGLLANVQVYNSSLSSADVASLYAEGIGGVPLNLRNLVMWLPLNGNSQDYSGNLNSGIPNNVVYTNNWANGYVGT